MKEASISTSVVFPVMNRFDLAKIAFLSIVNQTVRPSEIIIIDDGSVNDASMAMVQEIAIAKSYGISVKFFRFEENRGVSAARNKGVSLSTSLYVFFCDSDDFWISNKIEIIKKIILEKNVNIIFHAFIWDFGTLRFFKLLKKFSFFIVPRWILYIFSFLNPSCGVIKRDAFGQGFDETMRYHEDLDYWLRLSRSHSIAFLNAPLMSMGRSPGSEGGATHASDKMIEGAVLALKKNSITSLEKTIVKLKIFYVFSKRRLKIWNR